MANVNNLLTVDIEELQGIMWGVFECKSDLNGLSCGFSSLDSDRDIHAMDEVKERGL